MNLTKREEKIINLLDPKTPLHMDDIIARSRLQHGEALSILLSLEMRKLVKQLPGQAYILDASLPYFLGTSKARTWLEKHEAKVLRMLDPVRPRHLDKLAEWSELESHEVLAALAELEVRRLARRLRGEHYVKFVE